MGDGEGAIYIWTGVLRGRFEDNDNAWWHYDSSRKVLTMGPGFDRGRRDLHRRRPRGHRASELDLGNTSVAALPWEVAFPTSRTSA